MTTKDNKDNKDTPPPGPENAVSVEHQLAVATAHAQYLAQVVRGFIDRYYGLKVACGDMPADQMASRISMELDGLNATLTKLSENPSQS